MGYKKEPKIYKLVWNEGEYEGLIVRAKAMPLGKFLKLARLIDLDVKNITSEDIDSLNELFELFGSALVDWNVEDENDIPIPATTESLYEQELDFVLAIVSAYTGAISGVSDPLDGQSTDGSQSLEAGIPMQVDT